MNYKITQDQIEEILKLIDERRIIGVKNILKNELEKLEEANGDPKNTTGD